MGLGWCDQAGIEEAGNDLKSLCQLMKHLGVLLAKALVFAINQIRVNLFGPLPVGRTGPTGLQVIKKFVRQMNVGSEKNPASVEHLTGLKHHRHNRLLN